MIAASKTEFITTGDIVALIQSDGEYCEPWHVRRAADELGLVHHKVGNVRVVLTSDVDAIREHVRAHREAPRPARREKFAAARREVAKGASK